MNKVITISREFGSGGREIGKRLSEELGIAYYDNEIVKEIAKKTKLAETYVQQIVEKSPMVFFPITIGQTFYIGSDPNVEMSNSIYAEQEKIIRELAEKSPCVIVGRCADYILRDYSPFRLFVYADMDFKIKRCREKAPEGEHLTDKELARQIKSVDSERAKYYQFITGNDWGNLLNYDMCVNTTAMPIQKIVKSVAEYIK